MCHSSAAKRCTHINAHIYNAMGMHMHLSISTVFFFCHGKCHFVQTAHDNSFALSYGGQGSDPHLPSTK